MISISLKIPAPVGGAVCAVLFLLTRGIMYGYLGPAARRRNKAARVYLQCRTSFSRLGFRSPSFQSMDYFPLLPWFFVFHGRRLHRKVCHRGQNAGVLLQDPLQTACACRQIYPVDIRTAPACSNGLFPADFRKNIKFQKSSRQTVFGLL